MGPPPIFAALHSAAPLGNPNLRLGLPASTSKNCIPPDSLGARYYNPALGRFLTPDWSATPEAVPYANLENPQSLNLYSYVLNNPVTSTDADGHYSDLIFDGAAHTLTLVDKNGRVVGSWPAYDNVVQQDPKVTIGKLPDGIYPFLDTVVPHQHSPSLDSASGAFGPDGIFRLEKFIGPDGHPHNGVGVHSGREGKIDPYGGTGPSYVTRGCVRTCSEATHAIRDLIKTDPLETLKVIKNRPSPCKEQTSCGGASQGSLGPAKPGGGGLEEVHFVERPARQRNFSEHSSSGLEVMRSTIPEAITLLGNPSHFREVTNPDQPRGAGDRTYEWTKGGVKLVVGTGFRTDARLHTVIESPILYIDTYGNLPAGPVGVTGRGLRLGDSLSRAKRLYPTIEQGRPGKFSVTFPDGTFLAINTGKNGKIMVIALSGNPS